MSKKHKRHSFFGNESINAKCSYTLLNNNFGIQNFGKHLSTDYVFIICCLFIYFVLITENKE